MSNREQILVHVAEHGRITKAEACKLCPYYYNTAKHVGAMLGRLVKAGILHRESRGVYVPGRALPPQREPEQGELL